ASTCARSPSPRGACSGSSCAGCSGGRSSDVEACVLEIEVALDAMHDVVVDDPVAAKADDRAPLGLEQLAAESLVVQRPRLDLAVVAVVEARGEAVAPEVVETAHAFGGVLPDPVLGQELIEARESRVGGLDARLRVLVLGDAVVLDPERADEPRQT